MPLGRVEAKLHCGGHKTESIYGRNAIVDAGALMEAGAGGD